MAAEYEHHEQVSLFTWATANLWRWPELSLLFAIPNGGARDKRTGGKLKAEGVKKGVPDICLPVARDGCHGFYLELKAIYPDGSHGVPTIEQRAWIKALKEQGYQAAVYFGWKSAAEAIEDYLEGEK